jgi:hypothetical protein
MQSNKKKLNLEHHIAKLADPVYITTSHPKL